MSCSEIIEIVYLHIIKTINKEKKTQNFSSYLDCIMCPRRRQWHPTPALFPGKSHGRQSLVGCSPWGREVRHDWTTCLSFFTFMHWRRKWQPTPVFLPGASQGRRSPLGLPSMGSHRVRHDWSNLAAAAGNAIATSSSKSLVPLHNQVSFSLRLLSFNEVWPNSPDCLEFMAPWY